jgi:hypothetical protein
MTDRECKVNPVSSRVCEKGTKSCTVYHNDREQLCREFTELTGGHWHEWTEYQGNKCKCGLFRYRGTDNPTYENPADVLKKIIEIGLYDEFMVQYGGLSKFGRHLDCILVDLILEPDALLKAAVEFLREGKK